MKNSVLSNTRNTDTVTIPRAEYEAMQRQIDWLVEQLTLSKKRQYGSSSEKVSEGVMEQLSLLFNEAEAFAKLNRKRPKWLRIRGRNTPGM